MVDNGASSAGGTGFSSHSNSPSTPSLSDSFSDGASDSSTTSDYGTDFSSTVAAEIQIAQDVDQSMNRHDDRWQQLSDRLSNRPEPAPTQEMAGPSNRSITKEYNEHRIQWEEQRDGIEFKAIAATAKVRADGTTLTKTFAAKTKENPQSPTRQEFSAKAADSTHGRDR